MRLTEFMAEASPYGDLEAVANAIFNAGELLREMSQIDIIRMVNPQGKVGFFIKAFDDALNFSGWLHN